MQGIKYARFQNVEYNNFKFQFMLDWSRNFLSLRLLLIPPPMPEQARSSNGGRDPVDGDPAVDNLRLDCPGSVGPSSTTLGYVSGAEHFFKV